MFQMRQMESRTITWWHSRRDEIDMSPPYQRSGRLWSAEDRKYLIDSIINGFDIPKIYIADFTYRDSPLNERKLPYAVVDGKQRMESIFDFLDGKLTLSENFEYAEDRSLQLGGLSYLDLKKRFPRIASQLENYNLSVMSVITDEEGKINELFVRLNRSKPLTGAEKRNAMKGRVPVLIRDIAGHAFFTHCIRFATGRGQDRNAAAKLLLIEFSGRFAETKKRQLDLIVDEGIQSESQGVDRAAKRVVEVLKVMTDVFIEEDPLLSTQGPVVLYYELVKTTRTSERHAIREFLVAFETERRATRQEGATQDPELLEFDILRRSLNNTSSQVRCFSILQKRFRAFLSSASPDHPLQKPKKASMWSVPKPPLSRKKKAKPRRGRA
ncbi:MAG: DUF262 domain-containing protein [Planctomycetes bacterium]|nr:DUF262 domain-containing protein [Planctomycetota bacterium]